MLKPFSKDILIPQEERLAIQFRKSELQIGIPKEIRFQEKRICLTPDAVGTLVAHGHKIIIESGAGEGANYSDQDYAEVGAQITYDTEKVFKSNIVLKVEPPDEKEVNWLEANSIVISALQIKTQQKNLIDKLMQKKATSIAFEFLKDAQNSFPIVRAQSEIAGTASILIASEMLTKANIGKNLLLGNISGVPPASVVVIGAGTVGEFATKTAMGLGASVKVFDNSVTKLRRLKNLMGGQVYTSTIQPNVILDALQRADVVVGAIKGKERTPIIITEPMVQMMQDGSVLIDVSIDRGGISETSEVTTHSDPIVIKHGVVHYGVPNIPARYARTASQSLSNIFLPYLLDIGEKGGIDGAARINRGLRHGIYIYKGVLTNKSVGRWFDLGFKDINLFFI
jgi:alanine dehydrogenase